MTKKQTEDLKIQPRLYTAEPNLEKSKWNIQQTFILKLNQSVPEKKEEVQNVMKETERVVQENEAFEEEIDKTEQVLQGETTTLGEEILAEQDQQGDLDITKDIELVEKTEIATIAEVTKVAEESTEVIGEQVKETKSGKSQICLKDLTKKSFKDMDNEEKIYFFLHRPHYIPNVKCRVITEKDIYVGFIISYEDGYVSINSAQAFEKFHVKFEEIVSIQMMGI
ncbi:hypothetical protein COL60_10995 [Bacillus pseudomycoides]|uniref:CotO family spore coat protein n=1 Tax=Bacillus pseudomycoides TaxID=64104 RepID=UPI000BF25795|nr:CotO family spore coat protein [Bacillus pseudomycoides]PFZ10205.1 hypothetical protein COL60_10995 [Bacillus pseudomycoides]PGC29411.1 hypothetical protein COM11_13605 [Bacillus pseudomycoides]